MKHCRFCGHYETDFPTDSWEFSFCPRCKNEEILSFESEEMTESNPNFNSDELKMIEAALLHYAASKNSFDIESIDSLLNKVKLLNSGPSLSPSKLQEARIAALQGPNYL